MPWSLLSLLLVALSGCSLLHRGAYMGLEASSDGSLLATAASDNTIRVWSTQSLRQRWRAAHEGAYCVAFSPDGTLLASGGKDHTVRIWDAASGAERRVLTEPQEWVGSVAFSRDGTHLAASGWDMKLRLWRTSDWTQELVVDLPFGASSVAFSPDGRLIACAADRYVALFDSGTGARRQAFQVPDRSYSCVAFTADAKRVVAGDMSGRVAAFEADTGKEAWMTKVGSRARDILIAPGDRFVAACGDGEVVFLDPRDGRIMHREWVDAWVDALGLVSADPPAVAFAGQRTLRVVRPRLPQAPREENPAGLRAGDSLRP